MCHISVSKYARGKSDFVPVTRTAMSSERIVVKTIVRGFTLIELMIVVAVIDILASIALPAYQDYIARAKISEVILAISACRTSISETVESATSLPSRWPVVM